MTDTTSSPSSPAGQFFKARDPLMKSFCTSTISRADTGLRTYKERTASLQALHSNTWKQIIIIFELFKYNIPGLKTPTGRRQPLGYLLQAWRRIWTRENQEQNNRVSGHSMTPTWDHWIASSDMLTTWPCCLLLVCATIFYCLCMKIINHNTSWQLTTPEIP